MKGTVYVEITNLKNKFSIGLHIRDVIHVRRHLLSRPPSEKTTMTTTRLKQTLKTHFGFESFRSKLQEDVVKAVVKGKLKKRYI